MRPGVKSFTIILPFTVFYYIFTIFLQYFYYIFTIFLLFFFYYILLYITIFYYIFIIYNYYILFKNNEIFMMKITLVQDHIRKKEKKN